jgi:hypothetical protein
LLPLYHWGLFGATATLVYNIMIKQNEAQKENVLHQKVWLLQEGALVVHVVFRVSQIINHFLILILSNISLHYLFS